MDQDRRETDKTTFPDGTRSTDPGDYQDLSERVAVMPKRFPDGFVIAPHSHRRDQLIYSVSGVMRVGTSYDSWVIPPDRALLMPAGVEHSVEMHGDVEMRTLYIAPSAAVGIKVLTVSPLLRELISALALEPMDYAGDGRAEQIAALIGMELTGAEAQPLNIPLPRDARLQHVCQRLLADPSVGLSLDQLADDAGASSKTLSRLCQKELGMGFSAWRRRVRFSKAFELLGQAQPMKQVARRCGYASASAFTFAFRTEFGMTPTDFREH